jgi:hypothetical protein
MDIQKLIEMELKKILKEEEEVKDIQTKQSGVLKRSPQQPSDEKVVNIQTKQSGVLKRSTLEEDDKEIPVKTDAAGTLRRPKIKIGAIIPIDDSPPSKNDALEKKYLIKMEDGTIDANKAAGWVYVDPKSETDFSVKYVGTPEEQKAAKAAISNKKRARPEVKTLQQLINQYLASPKNKADSKSLAPSRLLKDPNNKGEDGVYGNDTKYALDLILKSENRGSRKQYTIAQMINILREILGTPTTPATAPAQQAGTLGGPGDAGSFTFRDMDVFKDWVGKQKPEELANKTFAAKASKDENYIIKYGPDGKPVGEPQKVKTSSLSGAAPAAAKESLQLRGMILQEILKTLK